MVEICVIMSGDGESESGATDHCSAYDKNQGRPDKIIRQVQKKQKEVLHHAKYS